MAQRSRTPFRHRRLGFEPPRRRLRFIEALESRYLLSLPPSLLIPEGEGTEQTAQLTRFYDGLAQLEAVGRRLEETAAAVAPVGNLAGLPFLEDGLDKVLDLSAAIKDITRTATASPKLLFADGRPGTVTSPDPSFSLTEPLSYHVSMNGGPALEFRADAPSPLPATLEGRADAWLARLNDSLTIHNGLGALSSLTWSKVSVPGEAGPSLQLTGGVGSTFTTLHFTTARVDAANAAPSFGQPPIDVSFIVNSLALRTHNGSDNGSGPPAPPIVLGPFSVNVPRNAASLNSVRTNDNATVQDLVADINQALSKIDVRFPSTFSNANSTDPPGSEVALSNRNLGTYLHAIVSNRSGSPRIAIVARTGSVLGFAMSGSALSTLGFTNTSNISVNDEFLPGFQFLAVKGQTAARDVNRQLLDEVASGSKTVSQAITELLVGMNPPNMNVISGINYDTQNKLVTFRLSKTFNQSSDLELNLNRSLSLPLGPVGVLDLEIAAQTSAVATANVSLALNVGISLNGQDGSSITADSLLYELNAGKGLMPIVGVAGTLPIPANVLPSSISFNLIANRTLNPTQRIERVISVNRSATLGNTAVQDLAADIQANIVAQGIGDLIEAKAIDGRMHFRAVDRTVVYVEVRADGRAAVPLGMTANPTARITLKSTDRPNPAQPPHETNQPSYPDLVVTLGQTNKFYVNLDQAVTVGQALAAINAQVPVTPPFATLETGGQLVLRSAGNFSVSSSKIGNLRSEAAEALGILGNSRAVTSGGSTHELRGKSLDTLEIADRVYLSTHGLGSSFTVGLTATASDLKIGAATGFAELRAESKFGSPLADHPLSFSYQLPLALKDPGIGAANDNRITLSELMDATPSSIFQSTTTTSSTLSGALAVRGSLFNDTGVTTAGRYGGDLATLTFGLGTPNDLSTMNLSATSVNFQQFLDQISNLSVENVLSGVRGVLTQWASENSQIGGFLRREIPLVGKAFGDVLDFTNKLDAAIDSVVSRVDADVVAAGLNELDSAVANLPYAAQLTLRLRNAIADARADVTRVRTATTTELASRVSRLIAAVSMIEQEMNLQIGTPAPPGGGEGEGEEDIEQELRAALSRLRGLLPSVNDIVTRVSTAIREKLPLLNGLQFKFDILADDDGNTANGQNLTILFGLLFNQGVGPITLEPNIGRTSFGPISVDASGDFMLTASAQVGLGLAIVVSSSSPHVQILLNPQDPLNPQNPNSNLVKTGLTLLARAVGQFDAEVGIGGASLAEGDIRLSLTNGPAGGSDGLGDAQVTFGFGGNTTSLGGILLPALNTASLSVNAIGSLNGRIGVNLLGQSVPDAVTLQVPMGFIAGTGVPPNWQPFVVNEAKIASLISDFEFDLNTILAGIELFLNQLRGLLQDRLDDVPLVGGSLEDLGGFIDDLKTKFVVKLKNLLAELPIKSLQEAQDAIRQELLNVLHREAGRIVSLRDGPDSNNTIEDGDLAVSLTKDSFEIQAYVGANLNERLSFDTKLPGLPLVSADGDVNVNIGVTAWLGLGVSRTDGFYLIPAPATTSNPVNPAGKELLAGLSVSLAPPAPGQRAKLELDLFALAVEATDSPTHPTGFNLNFDVDLGSGSKIFVDQWTNTPPVFSGSSSVNLGFDLEVVSEFLPAVTAELRGGWGFSFTNTGVNIQAPSISINNVRLDLDEFLGNFIGPAAQKIRTVLEPIKPAINLLRTPIPGISEISQLAGQGSVTLLDLALSEVPRNVAIDAKRFLTFYDALDKVISRITASGFIDFGSITFGGSALTTPDWNMSLIPNSSIGFPSTPALNVISSLNPNALSTAGELLGLMQQLRRPTDEDTRTVPNPPDPANPPSMDGLGITFELFEQPTRFIQLLLGQTVNLISWDIPELNLEFPWSQSFPVLPFPPISVDVGLNAGFHLAISVGFDSRGLKSGNLLDGFYFNDLRGGLDIDELQVSLGVTVAALLDAGIASAGLEGEILGKVKANWRDPDANGKLYLDEIDDIRKKQGISCLFDLSAELRAKLALVWEVLFFDGSIDIVDIVLMDTDNRNSCPAQVPAHVSDGNTEDQRGFRNVLPEHIAQFMSASAPGGIAPSGTLLVHAGGYADLRVRGDSSDTSEEFTITRIAPGVVKVKGMGMETNFGGVTRIIFDGGVGNDMLRLLVNDENDSSTSRMFDIPIIAFGGSGRDNLTGGSLSDSLFGNDGDDTLDAGPGADYVDGGSGTDSLRGDDGNDTLLGREGNDTIEGAGGSDILNGDEGNDMLWGGYINNTSTPAGHDSDANDVVDGGPQQDSIHGGPGADFLYGDGGDDRIYGDAGDDRIDGGDAHDYIDGGTGNDPWLHGGLGNDFVAGGDNADVIFGGWGNDVIVAHFLQVGGVGGTSSEYIEGGPDDDFICGGGEIDTIHGGTSNSGYDGVFSNFPKIPFDTIYPPMAGGYSLTSCTATEPPQPPMPVPGSAMFRVFRDRDDDGELDSNELYENGWRVRLTASGGEVIGEFDTADIDVNGNGRIDPATERGLVGFDSIEPGTYKATILLPSLVDGLANPYRQTTPDSNFLLITVSSAQHVDGGQFGVLQKPVVRGTVWNDLNANGVRNSGDLGTPGVKVYVDQDPIGGDGAFGFDSNATTQADGTYSIAVDGNLGQYYVRQELSANQTFPGPTTIYDVNFGSYIGQEFVGLEWSPAKFTLSPTGGSIRESFVGPFGNETATLTLSSLPDHERITISFDLYIIGSWEGSGVNGLGSDIDRWRANVRGGPTYFNYTFANVISDEFGSYRQSYSPSGSGSFLPRTGSILDNHMGYPLSSVYRVSMTLDHFGPSAMLDFIGVGLEGSAQQGLLSETWGMDNFRVVASSGGHLVNLVAEGMVNNIDFGNRTPAGLLAASVLVETSKVSVGFGSQNRFEGNSSNGVFSNGGLLSLGASTGSLSGIRYEDQNENGIRNTSEPGITTKKVYVDLNGNGILDTNEPQTYTSGSGSYEFNLATGTYTIREVLPTGWIETAPATRPFAISQGGKLTEIDPRTGANAHTRSINAAGFQMTEWIGIAYHASDASLLALGNGSSGNSYLFQMDPITAEATLVVRLDERLSEGDLAVEPVTGRLLAVTSRTGFGSFLVEINRVTGQVFDMLNIATEFEGGQNDPSAMAFASQTSLYVVDRNRFNLYHINPQTRRLLQTISLNPSNIGRVAGMVWDASMSNLLLVAGSQVTGPPADQSPGIYRVNPGTGVVQRLGTQLANQPENLSGMTLVPGMGHIVTLVADEFGTIAPISALDFGNIKPFYIIDGKDWIEGHSGNDLISGDNTLLRPRTVLIGDDDIVAGGLGNDTISGQDKNDLLWGGGNLSAGVRLHSILTTILSTAGQATTLSVNG